MLITTSLFDNRVLYSEPVKYIAKLRDIKTDNNTQLLKCKMEAAGHGGMSELKIDRSLLVIYPPLLARFIIGPSWQPTIKIW